MCVSVEVHCIDDFKKWFVIFLNIKLPVGKLEKTAERERCNQPIIYTANQTNAYNRIGHEILYRIVYNPRDLNSHLICSIQIFTWHITHTHPCMCVVCTQVIICNESLYPLMFVYNKRSRSIQEAQKWTVPATFEMKQSSFASSLLDEKWMKSKIKMDASLIWLTFGLSQFPQFFHELRTIAEIGYHLKKFAKHFKEILRWVAAHAHTRTIMNEVRCSIGNKRNVGTWKRHDNKKPRVMIIFWWCCVSFFSSQE